MVGRVGKEWTAATVTETFSNPHDFSRQNFCYEIAIAFDGKEEVLQKNDIYVSSLDCLPAEIASEKHFRNDLS